MLSMPTNIDFAEARRIIDEEYRNTEARLLLLKSQRNTFTNIARIPDEILLHIFSILRAECQAKIWLRVIWLRVTQVCRHWRRLSIDAPSLWTNPPTHLHDLTLLFLERSAPLCLDVRIYDQTSIHTATVFSNHIQRMRSLIIIGVQLDLLNTLQEALQHSRNHAPNLKRLSVSANFSQHTFSLSASTFRSLLLLETLELHRMNFDWTILPLPNLTSLILTCINMSVALSWQNFLETLRTMPLLELIRIDLVGLRLHAPSANAEKITLHRLSQLDFDGASDSQIRYFISKIRLPQLNRATLACTVHENDDGHLSTIQALSYLIEQANFGTLNTFSLGHGNFSLYQDPQLSTNEFYFSYRGCIETEQEAVDIITASVLRISSLNYGGISTLVHASLCGYGTPSDNDIVDLFAHLPLLESISLCDEMAMPFIDRFSIPVSTPATGSIPFANLKVINFYEEEETQFCSELYHKVLNCLMQRCEYGVPIQELAIGWSVTEEEFKALKEIVVDVYFELCGGIVQCS